MAKPKFDIYQHITDRIITALEEGVVPWRKPWADEGFHMSLSTGRPYRGMNQMLLAIQSWPTEEHDGYESPWWGTYKQITERGGQVRKGEKGTQIVYWGKHEPKNAKPNPKTGQVDPIWLARYFTVFNSEQADPQDGEDFSLPSMDEVEAHDPIETAEAIVDGYPSPPKRTDGGDRACYSPQHDRIQVPKHDAFDVSEEFYSTLFHELVHSTGHEKRLKRPGITDFDAFGSHQYSKEELIAEMGAAFLCAHAGIAHNTIDNSAAYIGNWLKRLKDDKKLVAQAAQAGQKAADHILNIQY